MKRLVPILLVCLLTSFFITSWQIGGESAKQTTDISYTVTKPNTNCQQSSSLTARCITSMASIVNNNSLPLIIGLYLFIVGLLRSSNWIKPYQPPISALFRPPIV